MFEPDFIVAVTKPAQSPNEEKKMTAIGTNKILLHILLKHRLFALLYQHSVIIPYAYFTFWSSICAEFILSYGKLNRKSSKLDDIQVVEAKFSAHVLPAGPKLTPSWV